MSDAQRRGIILCREKENPMLKIILSPAKTMRREEVIPPFGIPVFLNEAYELVYALKQLSEMERAAIWKCSEKLRKENEERLRELDPGRNPSPALFSYSGLAYSHLSPESLSDLQLAYLQTHLRILSGLYGILRPMDGIVPYRLEMGAALRVNGAEDLYAFWNRRIADDLQKDCDAVIDLASSEYSRAVRPYRNPDVRFIEIVFAERNAEGKLITKGTFAKMARGRMTRWMAEEEIEDPAQIRAFQNGYRYLEAESNETRYVFQRQ